MKAWREKWAANGERAVDIADRIPARKKGILNGEGIEEWREGGGGESWMCPTVLPIEHMTNWLEMFLLECQWRLPNEGHSFLFEYMNISDEWSTIDYVLE